MSSRESLSSPPGFHLPPLSGIADGIVSDEAEPTVIELTYHDTPDLRLARAGVTLLYRGDDGWVVTLGRETVAGPQLRHDEHRFEGEAGQPPPAAVDLVRGARAHRPSRAGGASADPPSSCRAPGLVGQDAG